MVAALVGARPPARSRSWPGHRSLFVARARLAGYRRGLDEARASPFDERLVDPHELRPRRRRARRRHAARRMPRRSPRSSAPTTCWRWARWRAWPSSGSTSRRGVRRGLRRRPGRGDHRRRACRPSGCRCARWAARVRRSAARDRSAARSSSPADVVLPTELAMRGVRPAAPPPTRRGGVADERVARRPGRARHGQQPRDRRRGRGQGRGRGRDGGRPLPRGRRRRGADARARPRAPAATAERFAADIARRRRRRRRLVDARASSASGAIDGLVNNAGRTQVGPFLEIEPAEWDEVIAHRPDRRVPHLPRGAAVDGRARQRLDREHRLAARPDGHRRDRRLQRRQGRADRPDAGARPRVRRARASGSTPSRRA